MADSRSLGELIRCRRAQLGLTQEALAKRIGNGIRQSDVSRLERGRVMLPRRERLERIAAALELPLGELLARSGWSGAQEAFTAPSAAEEPETESTHRTSRGTVSDVWPASPQAPRLGEAIARARATRVRTAELLASLDRQAEAMRDRLGLDVVHPPVNSPSSIDDAVAQAGEAGEGEAR